MANNDWITKLNRYDLRLCDVVIPGSHDAGVWKDAFQTSGLATSAKTVCQHGGIYKQACAGSRIMDCRVFLTKKGGWDLRMGHFFSEDKKHGTGKLGGYGGTLLTVLDEAVRFVDDNPGEFLILRISHTYCSKNVADAINAFAASKPPPGFWEKKYDDYLYKVCQESLAEETLDTLRGKVALCCERGYFHEYDKTWNVPFSKYSGTKANGLVTCGVFKGKSGMKDVHGNAAKGLNEHSRHAGDDHLLWIYWQQTGGKIEQNTTKGARARGDDIDEFDKKKGAHANLPPFISEIFGNVLGGKWKRPNVISHDFVTEETCSWIISLNKVIVGQFHDLPQRVPIPKAEL